MQTDWRHNHGRQLMRAGAMLFLVALLIGITIPAFAVPRLALSTHLLGLMQGLFLMLLGLMWPKLLLSKTLARAAFILVLYGCFAAWSANLLAAIWAAGNSLLPIAAGTARGTAVQELAIIILLRSGGASLIISTVIVVWGLRSGRDTAS